MVGVGKIHPPSFAPSVPRTPEAFAVPAPLPLKDQMAQDSYILDLNPEVSQFVPDLASVAKLDTNNPGAMLFLQGATLLKTFKSVLSSWLSVVSFYPRYHLLKWSPAARIRYTD